MRLPRLLALLSLAALAAGCNDSVAPTLDTGRPFTMWGVLDPTESLQGIRVVPIGLVLDESGSTPPLDARVESVDVATGERVAWRDSLVRFASGATGHVFVASFQPRYDALYEVTATRSDGAASRVRVRTPPAVEPIALEVTSANVLPVLFTQAPSLNIVHVTYVVQMAGCGYDQATFDVPIDGGTYPFDYGWRVDLPLGTLAARLRSHFETQSAMALVSAKVEGFVSNTEWRPIFGTPYDPEILVEPGTIENVENGFGFVGAGFTTSVLWRQDPEEALFGFTTPAVLGCL